MHASLPRLGRFRAAFAAFAVSGLALAPAAVAQQKNMADLKGQALMEYLQTQRQHAVPVPEPTAAHVYPTQSVLRVYPIPYERPAPDMRAYVMAHLPEGSELRIEGEVMVAHADKPMYELQTPALEKGLVYHYTAQVRWFETGKWVTQVHTFAFKVGDTHCIEIAPNKASDVVKEIASSMAALSPGDRTAAEAQKFCAVQNTVRLGSMGKPAKVSVAGKDVFLCCDGCRAAALKDPAKAAATAEKNATVSGTGGGEK